MTPLEIDAKRSVFIHLLLGCLLPVPTEEVNQGGNNARSKPETWQAAAIDPELLAAYRRDLAEQAAV